MKGERGAKAWTAEVAEEDAEDAKEILEGLRTSGEAGARHVDAAPRFHDVGVIRGSN